MRAVDGNTVGQQVDPTLLLIHSVGSADAVPIDKKCVRENELAGTETIQSDNNFSYASNDQNTRPWKISQHL